MKFRIGDRVKIIVDACFAPTIGVTGRILHQTLKNQWMVEFDYPIKNEEDDRFIITSGSFHSNELIRCKRGMTHAY